MCLHFYLKILHFCKKTFLYMQDIYIGKILFKFPAFFGYHK